MCSSDKCLFERVRNSLETCTFIVCVMVAVFPVLLRARYSADQPVNIILAANDEVVLFSRRACMH